MPGAKRGQMKVHSLHRRSKGRAWVQLEDILLARMQAAHAREGQLSRGRLWKGKVERNMLMTALEAKMETNK